jgi:RNA polymerase sigma factor (sigma-70 family)
VLERLPWREREILKLHYGLADGEPRSLTEIGKVFKLSRERIRQLAARALESLRQSEPRHRLEPYL